LKGQLREAREEIETLRSGGVPAQIGGAAPAGGDGADAPVGVDGGARAQEANEDRAQDPSSQVDQQQNVRCLHGCQMTATMGIPPEYESVGHPRCNECRQTSL